MRVSFLAMIAVVAITLLSFDNDVSAMRLPQDGTAEAMAQDDVMKGVSKWKLDNEHTSMVCAVSHYGLSFIYGRFNQCSGTVELNFEDPASSRFRIEVNPSSIDTNDVARNMQLSGPDGLDTAQFDSITFDSATVEVENNEGASKTGRRFQVTGNLTLHGETRRIKIPIDLLGMGKGPKGDIRCGFMSRFVVNRSEFGLDALSDTVGDSVAVTFCFQTVYQKAEFKDDESRFRSKEEPVAPEKDPESERDIEAMFSPKPATGDDDVAPGAIDEGKGAGETERDIDAVFRLQPVADAEVADAEVASGAGGGDANKYRRLKYDLDVLFSPKSGAANEVTPRADKGSLGGKINR